MLEAAEKADAVAIGPGLGRSDGTVELVADPARAARAAGRRSMPMRSGSSSRSRAHAPTVLTPHTGELAGLLGVERARSTRIGSSRCAAPHRRFGSVVLLKGADTLVAAPREGVLVASYGTPALATAGSGDVLTGVVAAFLAKGMEPRLAAATAAVAHGVAAELVEPQRGVLASRPAAGAPARARRPRPAARTAA